MPKPTLPGHPLEPRFCDNAGCTRWRYALPLDTALVTSRVRACARVGGKKRSWPIFPADDT